MFRMFNKPKTNQPCLLSCTIDTHILRVSFPGYFYGDLKKTVMFKMKMPTEKLTSRTRPPISGFFRSARKIREGKACPFRFLVGVHDEFRLVIHFNPAICQNWTSLLVSVSMKRLERTAALRTLHNGVFRNHCGILVYRKRCEVSISCLIGYGDLKGTVLSA